MLRRDLFSVSSKSITNAFIFRATNDPVFELNAYNHPSCSDYFFYIGEITNIISADLGIYELDSGDVILHTAYQLCVDYGIGRRIGSVIMITCAHQFQVYNQCCKYPTLVVLLWFRYKVYSNQSNTN